MTEFACLHGISSVHFSCPDCYIYEAPHLNPDFLLIPHTCILLVGRSQSCMQRYKMVLPNLCAR